jgi:hypothetical protein
MAVGHYALGNIGRRKVACGPKRRPRHPDARAAEAASTMRACIGTDPRPATWTPSGRSVQWRCTDSALRVLATRNPKLLFLSAGALLLRLDARQFLSLLFQEPPRQTPSQRAVVADLSGASLAPRTTRTTPLRSACWACASHARCDRARSSVPKRPAAINPSIARNLRVARRTDAPKSFVRPPSMAKPRKGNT